MAPNSLSNASDNPIKLIGEYLSADQVDRIYLIACREADFSWPASAENIVRIDGLDDALAHLESWNAASPSTSPHEKSKSTIAILRLDADSNSHETTLGLAVRVFPERLIVYTHDSKAVDSLFFSFGFRKLSVEDHSGASSANRWYEFRLSHYKLPPDWLNARFWAHPERFTIDEEGDEALSSAYEDEEE